MNQISLKNISKLIRKNIEKLEETIIILRTDISVKNGVIINLLYELKNIENLKIDISIDKK